jgi:anti-sigma factor RsiW
MSGHLAERLDAFVDGELTPQEVREAEGHLVECDLCRRRVDSRRALSATLRASLPRYAAPASVRPITRRRLVTYDSWWWKPAAAALILIGVAGLGGYGLGRGAATANATRDAVVSSHIRSLLASHLTDVVSSDRHTVKPWFNGVLDFAPTVVDLAAQGFPLVGGRIDYIGGRRVAALVYGRNRHMINVFEWPTTERDAPVSGTVERGYTVLYWVRGGIEYWMVSDLNEAEMRQAAALLRE